MAKNKKIMVQVFKSDAPILFRPPFGKLNLATWLYSLFSGLDLAFWNVDPKDYSMGSADEIVDHVILRARPGAVVLFHDGRNDPTQSATVTVAALRVILGKLKHHRLKMATVSEAMRNAS